jgi:ABC-2 type transport system permease protein
MNTFSILRRDFAAYLQGYTGWIIIAAVLLIEGLLFNVYALGGGEARYSHEVLSQFFHLTSGFVMVAGILLSMRTIAEERQEGTDVLLQTSVVTDFQIVLAKYTAAMGMLLLLLALTIYLPMLVFVNGKVSWAHIGVGYLGLALFGSVVVSIGVFGSSLFKSQLPAGVLAGVIVAVLLTAWMLADVTDPPFTDVAAYVALYDKHFQPFRDGRLLSSGVVFYVSLSALFLWLTTRVLEGRRWE